MSVSDRLQVRVEEQAFVRKYADPVAHARGDAEAVLRLHVTTIDGIEVAREVVEVRRGEDGFDALDRASLAAEQAARSR